MRSSPGVRGRTLKSPTWDGLRPTSDRLRETLFNILGPSIRGARVLDGYAGTGAIGIEALSRGAAHVDVRGARRARGAADRREPRMIDPGGTGRRAIIRACFADAAARLAGAPFDLIIVDPPYAHDAAEAALAAARHARRALDAGRRRARQTVSRAGRRRVAPPAAGR
jgi:16S rRNA (guanine966-N2)-methyltransferase